MKGLFTGLALGMLTLEALADPATNFAPAVLAAGPVAYWRLNESSGTKAKDWVGGHDGTNHNIVLNAPGPVPPTFAGLTTNNLPYGFNGSNGYVQTALSISGNQGTFMALVKPNGVQASGAGICDARGSGANVCALCMQGDGVDIQYVWANDSGTWNFNPGFAPPPNQWTFVAVSVSPTNAVMYMDAGNGLIAATNIHNHGVVTAAGPIVIGGDPVFNNKRYFNGGIAEVAVFNRTLTLAEIAGIDQFACVSNLTLGSFAFDPVHYRPLPVMTAGLATNCLLLDGGDWLLNPAPGGDALSVPLSDPSWTPFQVPGQWLQQGFNVSQDQPVAMAKGFAIPGAWNGKRIILRFDAIHAGTTYWLNGTRLGYSENLFTPVEWDITAAALPGQTNRLDLQMQVNTLSEQLADASGYARYNLGGIDRSVRLFALPPICIRQLRLNAGLDASYRDGTLEMDLLLDSGQAPATNLSLAIQLLDPNGEAVQPSVSQIVLPPFTGTNAVSFLTQVAAPLQWNAETPNLYSLTLELRQGETVLEQLQRNLGFRTIETRNGQLYLNGRRIKLAGACHHEIDPLTGRANTMCHAETDVRLFKQANLNHIRTSHYPPTAELLDAADRLGMYVEVEAPFCWVGSLANTASNLSAVLTPTSAMVDYHHSHPSVIVWSIANESTLNYQFVSSASLLKQWDPTRPTTFNNPGGQGVTDIANVHYPAYPYDSSYSGDPRPVYLGEYFFEVYHERTDVAINPGLKELWGFGQAEPDSAFAQALIPGFSEPPLKPGLRPGGWSYIYHSDHLAGASIWAGVDDISFLPPSGQIASSESGNAYWGLLDSWRRPKPEWWLARHIFSPVWLQTRHPSFVPGQTSVSVPVENRYAFTDFSQLKFCWAINGQHGQFQTNLAPGATNFLQIPVPPGSSAGDTISLSITNAAGVLVDDAVIWLGSERPEAVPQPAAGPPRWSDDGNTIVIRGAGFAAVFNRAKGDFDPGDSRHCCPVISFPALHVTRYDFGDLNRNAPPYAVFPDPTTRVFGSIVAQPQATGLLLTVNDSYQYFTGATSWLIDQSGLGVVSCNYTYSGAAMNTRGAGIHLLLQPADNQLQWRRWSEWGTFPSETITRTVGTAPANRDPVLGTALWNQPPAWPWALDQTSLGTADFRGVKFNIYQATLAAPDGSGLTAHANADAHFRAAVNTNGVDAYLLWQCPSAQAVLNPGDRLTGQFVVQLNGLVLQATQTVAGLVLSWPLLGAGSVLESTPDLVAPAWAAVSASPVTNATSLTVTLPTSGARRFYRLRHP